MIVLAALPDGLRVCKLVPVNPASDAASATWMLVSCEGIRRWPPPERGAAPSDCVLR